MTENSSNLDKAIELGLRDREFFDWPNAQDVLNKVKEEISELEEAMSQNDSTKTYEEFSDTLFTLLQLARHLKIGPEENLAFALKKYNLRSKKMFELVEADQKDKSKLSLDELESYWSKSKLATAQELNKILDQQVIQKN